MSKLVCVGQIINVHGIKGAVKIKVHLVNPMDIDTFGDLTDQSGKKIFRIKALSQKQGIVLATVQGVTDRTKAESLKGVRLYVAREKLPQEEMDEFYCIDLIGLKVFKGEEVFGVVESIDNFGAGDIVNVRLNGGKVFPFDFSDATFPVVDIENGFMQIELPDGIREVLNED